MGRTVLVPDSGCEFDIVSEHSGDSLVEQRDMRTEKQYTVEWPVLFWLCAQELWEYRGQSRELPGSARKGQTRGSL